ncbi:hypothetical protein [Phenylobacterium sp.]|uniref:hypothetical protein n=1 Tax=Phenylobacterium sp. TaxID=1871053 RepID=UPI002E30B527|nr:hypothetical protein [Phenylobacterium sp.]HEX2560272.1 hypothetical protein [Phenylobacterium sp.]
MTEPRKTLQELLGLPSEVPQMDAHDTISHFRRRVERNKTRRRRDGDPPAALPVPALPRGGGGLCGGATAPIPPPDQLADAVR